MRLPLIATTLAFAALVSLDASAALVINVGNPTIRPNEANQRIAVRLSGDMDVRSVIFNFEVFRGSNQDIPRITKVDIVGPGTIFATNNTGQRDESVSSTGSPRNSQFATATTGTDGSFLSPNGVLAFVTFDATGIFSGSYQIDLVNTLNGSTTFNGSTPPSQVRNATLNVAVSAVPEPSSLALCGLLAGGLACRRVTRRRNRASAVIACRR